MVSAMDIVGEYAAPYSKPGRGVALGRSGKGSRPPVL